MEKQSPKDGSANFKMETPNATNSIWTQKALLKRLSRNPEARAKFVGSHISNGIAFQIRALRKRNRWSQPQLAEEVGTTQNQIYRLEKPATAKPTISTLKRIAAVFDVALVVRFVPFSQVIAWVSGTPFTDRGLSTESLAPVSFGQDRIEERPAVRREREFFVTRFHRRRRVKQASETVSAPISAMPQITTKERRWIPKQALSGHGQRQMPLPFGSADCSGAGAKIVRFPLSVGAGRRFVSTSNLAVGRGAHYGR